ncbi:MAG: DUF969 domain-containing protein [Erysipelotrichaceae bacterium]|nr:DUF969 domain-containing protein [Erysipelotrichaceae bacterium]
MEYLKLLGILVVIVGFALKIDNILIIVIASIVTAIVGGIGPVALLQTVGSTFVANRSMLIFVVVMLATGTLERNGLKQASAALISKIKGATPGAIVNAYGVLRAFFGAFNVGLGGVAGFVRPVVIPMCEGAITSKGLTPDPEHMESVKGMAAGIENITWFFSQVLVVGGSGALLVQGTLADLGYTSDLVQLAGYEVPVCIAAVVVTLVYYTLLDRHDMKKYCGKEGK